MSNRRLLVLVVLSSLTTSLLLYTLNKPPPELPLPAFLAPKHTWPEFDTAGSCLFISPLSELTEKELAEAERQVTLAAQEGEDGKRRGQNGVFQWKLGQRNEPSENNDDGLDDLGDGVPSIGGGPYAKVEKQGNPILGLLKDGERKWVDIMERQSRSLDEAVEVYRQRYKREPPKGFELWYSFVLTNNILLPDEYDSLMHSIEPFWGLPPREVARRVDEAEEVPETFTLLVKEGGKVVLQWNDDYSRDTWWSARSRADNQINLMEPFLAVLGDMKITFTIHNNPSIIIPAERREELVGFASGGHGSHTSKVDEKDSPEIDILLACPPDSPARTGVSATSSDTINFVTNHLLAMDPCQHSELFKLHSSYLVSQTASTKPTPHSRLLPILSLSGSAIHADIPVAPVGLAGVRREDTGKEPDGGWDAKSNKLYWRGPPTSTTGTPIPAENFPLSHRSRLHLFTHSNSSSSQKVLVPIPGRQGLVEEVSYPSYVLEENMLDVQLEGPWKCAANDGVCEQVHEDYGILPKDLLEQSNAYKYVLDIDGDSWSKSFPRLMASRSMVLKAGIFHEWNAAVLPEWFAYVPVNLDFSDLYSILAFFRGSPEGAKSAHDRVAHRIASNGQCWIERTWRKEDMQAYAFRLYLEYARVIHPKRDEGVMDYHHVARPQVRQRRRTTESWKEWMKI